jgi:hypothetical protein
MKKVLWKDKSAEAAKHQHYELFVRCCLKNSSCCLSLQIESSSRPPEEALLVLKTNPQCKQRLN